MNKNNKSSMKVIVDSHGKNFVCAIRRQHDLGCATILNLSVNVTLLSISDYNRNSNVLFKAIKSVKKLVPWLPESDEEKKEIACDISKAITPLFSHIDSCEVNTAYAGTCGYGRQVKN